MAYSNNNRLRTITHIISVYHSVKEHDVPDSHIVRYVFPKHNIFISYRKWMNIKNMKQPQAIAQRSLFDFAAV